MLPNTSRPACTPAAACIHRRTAASASAAISPGHAHTRPHLHHSTRVVTRGGLRAAFAVPAARLPPRGPFRAPPAARGYPARARFSPCARAIPCGGSGRRWDEQERGLEPDGRWPLTASLSVRRARRQDRKATPKLRTRLSLAWFDLIRLSLTSSRPPIRCQSVAARPSVSRYTP